MPPVAYLVERALWIAPPLIVGFVALLAVSIRDTIRTVKAARLLAVPLIPSQEIEFPVKGRVVLCSEGPLLSRRFAGLTYGLTLEGRPIASRPSLFRARTSGLASARTELRYVDLPVRGSYVLTVEGLPADTAADDDHRLVFMRPHLARSLAGVIGILLASAGLIGSLVLLGVGLAPPDAVR